MGIVFAYLLPGVKRILVVEDETLIRSSLAHELRKDGLVVTEAGDYSEALKELKNEGCDLAVVDLFLEDEMHGMKLIGDIHSYSPETKIIVVTAFGMEEVKQAAMKEGIDGFYEKPFRLMDIRNAVREMLGGGDQLKL